MVWGLGARAVSLRCYHSMPTCLLACAEAGAVVGLAAAAVGWAGAADVGCAAGDELGPQAALTETPATSKPRERKSPRRVGPRCPINTWSFKFMNLHCAFVFNSAHLPRAQWSDAPTITTQVPCSH